MHNGDVLGDEGRKALNACVKVRIYGKPETRRYDRTSALNLVKSCYANFYLQLVVRDAIPENSDGQQGCDTFNWCRIDLYVLKRFNIEIDELLEDPKRNKTFDIVDIQDTVVHLDKMSFVQKYPEGPQSDSLKDLIDNRRADVEKELEEATADPDGRHRYSWVVAQRRVRDCYAGTFAEDKPMFDKTTCNIIDIHKAVAFYDEKMLVEKYGADDDSSRREEIDSQRADVEKEYTGTVSAANTNAELPLRMYPQVEAEERVMNCYRECFPYRAVILPFKINESGMPATTPSYNIFDIHDAVIQYDGKKLLEKYPDKGPGSDELKKLIDDHRANLEEDYQKATSASGIKTCLHEYSQPVAERRVRDCFAGSFPYDTDIFPTKKDETGIPKIYQTYDIFDIKEALDHFDAKKFLIKYPEERPGDECPEQGLQNDKVKQFVDEKRADIHSEYITATTNIEIEHGSGFIVHDHFIITNRHVVETYLNKPDSHEIRISNAAIGELACKVAHYDAGKDLALVYCPDLNLEQSGICPLQLSHQALLPGMSVFSFGYPMSHTGETALFVSGNVSGSKKTLAGHSMVVLNCSLNSGNSGGPVLCWVKGQLRVVGVATQKHFKEILTLEERETVEKIRESLQTHAIPDVPDDPVKRRLRGNIFLNYDSYLELHPVCQTSMSLLTLKLYDALETHSQFNLSNALPGRLVVDFIKDSVSKCTGEYKEELDEMIKLSEDHVNILPSGHLSASQCCIQ